LSETGVQQGDAALAASSDALEWPVERLIRPAKRRLRARDLVGMAPVVRTLAARDFKVKYKQSALGPLWLVFQPIALLAGFLVAFRGLADVQTGVPYTVFALVGLTVWAFFQASMTIGTASVVTNLNYVRFTPCPRPAFPIAATIASLPAFAVTATGAIVAALVSGVLSPRVVLVPFVLVWLVTLTLGLVAISSALTVRYRDIANALPFLLQVGLFLAPVGYPLADLSDTVRAIVDANPLTGIIEAFRWTMLSGYQPSAEPVIISAVETVVLAVAGWRFFSLRETTMADDI
jgi:homopolymeric O-antigen transport system permease protein